MKLRKPDLVSALLLAGVMVGATLYVARPRLNLVRIWPTRHPVICVAVSGDGRRALSASYDQDTWSLWDRDAGAELGHFEGSYPSHFVSAALTPDGKRTLLCGCGGGLLDTGDGRLLTSVSGSNVTCGALSPDGGCAMTGVHGYESPFVTYDVRPSVALPDCASPAGKYPLWPFGLATARRAPVVLALTDTSGRVAPVTLWEITGATLQLRASLTRNDRLWGWEKGGCDLSPDGERALVFGEHTIDVLDVGASSLVPRRALGRASPIVSAIFLGPGRVVSLEADGRLTLEDVEGRWGATLTGQLDLAPPCWGRRQCLAALPDGSGFLVAGHEGVLEYRVGPG